MSPRRYQDLKLVIESAAEAGADHYRVSVLESPAGETTEPEIVIWQADWTAARIGGARRALGPSDDREGTDETAYQDFGARLFDTFLTGEVGRLFVDSRLIMRQQGAGLRLKLQVEAPDLATVPWELLFDSRSDAFVALSSETPVVRHVRLGTPLQALTVDPPLRILGMVANPTSPNLASLDVAHEKALIEEALEEVIGEGLVQMEWTDDGTLEDLQEKLIEGPWHVFHFIGHGGFDPEEAEGHLVVEDDRGGPAPLDAESLATLLRDAGVRLTVLNACKGASASTALRVSGTAGTLMRRGMGGVVAMQNAIGDSAAITFARVLYTAIAQSLPIDAAVAAGRIAIKIQKLTSHEWWTPVLHLRSEDGRLFETGTEERNAFGKLIESGLDDFLVRALQRRAWIRRGVAAWLLAALPVLALLVLSRRPSLTVAGTVETTGASWTLAEPLEFIDNEPSLRELTAERFISVQEPGQFFATEPQPGEPSQLVLRSPRDVDGTVSLNLPTVFPRGTSIVVLRAIDQSLYRITLQSDEGITVTATATGTLDVGVHGRAGRRDTFPISPFTIRAGDQALTLTVDFLDRASVRIPPQRVSRLSFERPTASGVGTTIVSGSIIYPGSVRPEDVLDGTPLALHGLCRSETTQPEEACRLTNVRLTESGMALTLRVTADSATVDRATIAPPRLIEWIVMERRLYAILATVAWILVALAGVISLERYHVTLPE